MRLALSVAEVRLLSLDLVTEETLGSQMSVTRRVNATACLALSCCLGGDSQGGGANSFDVLDVECGRGVKKQRMRACIA
jgi:hypothetical protein